MSVDGIIHLPHVEYLDITSVTNQTTKWTNGGKWKIATPMKTARSGFALFSWKRQGVLTAIGGWPPPSTADDNRPEENGDIDNGYQWSNVGKCFCPR